MFVTTLRMSRLSLVEQVADFIQGVSGDSVTRIFLAIFVSERLEGFPIFPIPGVRKTRGARYTKKYAV